MKITQSSNTSRWLLILLGSLIAESVTVAEERYFVLIFGSQSSPKRPKDAHSWATLVKTSPSSIDPTRLEINQSTISWLPATLNIRVLALRPEKGVNLTLDETIAFAVKGKQEIAVWGPFELTQTAYEKGIRQVAKLDSGELLYQALDPDVGPRVKRICNCIHALSDTDDTHPRYHYFEVFNYGHDASKRIACELVKREAVINRDRDHTWVFNALGLDRQPVSRPEFRCPRFSILGR